MRYDAEHKERTRNKVLDIAAKALREEGVARMGVKPLMAQAGLTHGGFYAHFDSKETLVAAAIDRMFDQVIERAAEALHSAPGRAGIAAYVDMYLSTAHRDGPGEGCPVAALAAEAAHLDDESRARFAAGYERQRKLLASALSDAQYEGAPLLAASLFAELSGTIALARAMGPTAQSQRLLRDIRRSVRSRLGL